MAIQDKIEKLDNESDAILYSLSPEEIKEQQRIRDLEQKVGSISSSYNSSIGTTNTMEFLTQVMLSRNELQGMYINQRNPDGTLPKGSSAKDQMQGILNTGNAMSLFAQEKNRIDQYSDYVIADAYIPVVSRCLDLYRDCIMSPDDVSKESCNIIYSDTTANKNLIEKFNTDIADMKEKFDIDSEFKTWIRTGLLKGDTFVGVLDIDEELNKIILTENHEANSYIPKSSSSMVQLNEEDIFTLHEHGYNTPEEVQLIEGILLDEDVKANVAQLNSTIGVLKPKDKKKVESTQKELTIDDIKTDIAKRINENIICINDKKDRQEYKNLYKAKKDTSSKSNEELSMSGCILKTFEPERMLKLELEKVCFGYIYIEKYDMNDTSGGGFGMSTSDMLTSSVVTDMVSTSNNIERVDYFNVFKGSNSDKNMMKERFLTDLFVKGISKKMNRSIIEENSQLKELIYELVRRDYITQKKIRITYYEPDEIFHYKPNSDGGTYGVSKLAKVMFYIRLHLSNILTETMQKISRGRDKRVVYVETGIDDDQEGAIEGVIRDFRSKEIQADSLGSIDTVFKTIGSFEDYFIPKFDGESPLEIETLSGMDTNVDNDFVEYLQKNIVTGMGLPATYVDATNDVDFSRSLVMQNNPFVREIVSLQHEVSKFGTAIVRKIYKCEYLGVNPNEEKEKEEYKKNLAQELKGTNKGRKDTYQPIDLIESLEERRRARIKGSTQESELITLEQLEEATSKTTKDDDISLNSQINLEYIELNFPIPQYLNISAIQEQIQNYTSQIEFVSNTIYGENTSDEKNEAKKQTFKREYTKTLVTNIDWDPIYKLAEKVDSDFARSELEKKVSSPSTEEGEGSEDVGDLDF